MTTNLALQLYKKLHKRWLALSTVLLLTQMYRNDETCERNLTNAETTAFKKHPWPENGENSSKLSRRKASEAMQCNKSCCIRRETVQQILVNDFVNVNTCMWTNVIMLAIHRAVAQSKIS